MPPATAGAPLSPLDRFPSTRDLRFRDVEGSGVPEPYRALLVHERDMTSTLAEFHGEELVLRVDRREIEEPWLFRKVALVGERSGRPVEFGAIRIDLSGFEDRHRSQIESGIRPLGALLTDGAGPFVSAPTGFFRIQTTREIEEALCLATPARLWGRRNVLSRPDGRLLAEVVEILPPLPRSGGPGS